MDKDSSVSMKTQGSADDLRSGRRRENSVKVLSIAPSLELLSQRPMGQKPTVAVRQFAPYLPPHELNEIINFPRVYYVGHKCKTKPGFDKEIARADTDDDKGCYIMRIGDHIAYRYEIQATLGEGSFGNVIKAFDHFTQEQVAIKVIRRGRRYQHQADVEIRILERLKQADPQGKQAVIRMLDHFIFRSHVCITYEVLSRNLFENLKTTNYHPIVLTDLKRIALTLLKTLAFLHENSIIHCDLKPENILLVTPKSKTSVKLIDLGTACYDNHTPYSYVQSRFYRAPEVILGIGYDHRIDIWSLGCVLCELATGFPLFPGEDEHEQLQCIMEVLDVPPIGMITKSARRKRFFDEAKEFAPILTENKMGRRRIPGNKSLARFLAVDESNLFLDFVKCFLVWEPTERITPQKALQHSWLADVVDSTSLPANGS